MKSAAAMRWNYNDKMEMNVENEVNKDQIHTMYEISKHDIYKCGGFTF